MTCSCRFKLLAVPCAVALLLGGFVPAFAADAGRYASQPANGWQFSFTPFGWATSINGNATARGHTVDIDENFMQIIEKSDSIMALMGYFEARKGRVGLFTDVVWADLGFPGDANVDRSGNLSGQPFEKLPKSPSMPI